MMAFFITSGISCGLSTTGQRQYASQPDAVRVTITWGEATRRRSCAGLRSQKDAPSAALMRVEEAIAAEQRSTRPTARRMCQLPGPPARRNATMVEAIVIGVNV